MPFYKEKETLLVLVACALIAVGVMLLVYVRISGKTFTPERWQAQPRDRLRLMDSLLEKHTLVGMYASEVERLLGKEDSVQPSFKGDRNEYDPASTLVYYLGGRGIDDVWLVLSCDEAGVVTGYTYGVT